MTEFFGQFGPQYLLFLAKAITWVVAILLVSASFFSLVREAREHRGQEHLEATSLNQRYEAMADALKHRLLSAHELKQEHKQQKAEHKAREKAERKSHVTRPRVFVLDFHGDMAATATDNLREEISAVLQVVRAQDEALLRLESQGGLVHAYGLAASQLQRLRDKKLRLTVAVDKVAASGGYLMACVADRIIAAPFAVVGSIGVVAQLPNFNRLLKKHEVDFELHTAGEFKRTLTMFGENTEAARAKFREELEDTHALFKSFVAENRPALEMDKVATGEHWFGARALALKLVDEIKTSDDFLLEKLKNADLVQVSFRRKQTLGDRLAHGLAKLTSSVGVDKQWPRSF